MTTNTENRRIDILTADADDIRLIQMVRRHFGTPIKLPPPTKFDIPNGFICKVAKLCKHPGAMPVIAGYAIFRRLRHRLLLQNLAVLPEYRNCGIGNSLVESLIELLDDTVQSIVALVPEDLLATQLLLAKHKFRAVEILKTRRLTYYRMVFHKDRTLYQNRITEHLDTGRGGRRSKSSR